jgi:hypothetical protein
MTCDRCVDDHGSVKNWAPVVAVIAAWFVGGMGSAAVAAPWSEPVDLGPGTDRISGQLLEFTAAGVPQFTYSMPTPEVPGQVGVSAFARRRPDGTVIRDLLRDDMIDQARFGRRSWVVLRYREPRGPDGRALLRVSSGTGPGELGAPQTLARYFVPDRYSEPATFGGSVPQIASSPSGNVAIMWTEVARHRADGSTDGARVRLVYRLVGGGFSRPTTVAEQRPRAALRNARLTFHGPSAVTVTYVRNAPTGTRTRRTVEARVLRLGGHRSAPQTLGPAPESSNDLCIAAAPGGRTVVAWANVHGTVMGARSRYTVRAALRAPNARRFGTAQVLDPGVENVGAPGELGAGIADDGAATVAWSAHASSDEFSRRMEVRAATAAPAGRFGAVQVLTTDGRLTDLVVSNNGATLAIWSTDVDGNEAIRSALRPARATAFAAAETVAVVMLRYYDPLAPNADAAFDPVTGRFGIIWATDQSAGSAPTTQVPDGVARPGVHVPGSARLLLATREAR